MVGPHQCQLMVCHPHPLKGDHITNPVQAGMDVPPLEGAEEDPHLGMNRVGGNRLWMGGHVVAGQTEHPATMVEITHPEVNFTFFVLTYFGSRFFIVYFLVRP